MPATFDPLKSAKEELYGLTDVYRTLTQREHKAEEAMSAAEQELNAIRKLTGYCRITVDALKRRIVELEQQR